MEKPVRFAGIGAPPASPAHGIKASIGDGASLLSTPDIEAERINSVGLGASLLPAVPPEKAARSKGCGGDIADPLETIKSIGFGAPTESESPSAMRFKGPGALPRADALWKPKLDVSDPPIATPSGFTTMLKITSVLTMCLLF